MTTPNVPCAICTSKTRSGAIFVVSHDAYERDRNIINTPATAIPNERVERVRATLAGIANAKRYDRDVFADDSAFVDWAMSLAKHTLAELGE